MISMSAYWNGRDKQYAAEFTPQIESNGNRTVACVNVLLDDFETETGICMELCASGWRPKGVNAETQNAASTSKHITAEALDVRDTVNRDFARWLAKQGVKKLEQFGLYCERFEWTPSWVHLSPFPPASGKRCYIPSNAPAKCARLPEQDKGM